MAAYPGRVTVVAIDYPDDNAAYGVDKELVDFCSEYPGWAQEYFALGRIAMHITKSKRVISAGGGGIAGAEAMAGFGAGVQWTVYVCLAACVRVCLCLLLCCALRPHHVATAPGCPRFQRCAARAGRPPPRPGPAYQTTNHLLSHFTPQPPAGTRCRVGARKSSRRCATLPRRSRAKAPSSSSKATMPTKLWPSRP